ncbi:MAG TPA: heavy metal translocating P-type ATPase metal-binding domain-containing protein, partial [Polyangiaceae bacterium]
MTASATLSNVGLECLHCGNAMNGVRGEFCCEGCRVVYGLLHDEHLERYYDLRGDRGAPVADLHLERRDRKWLEAVDSKRAAASGTTAVDVDVQGIHCAACVWLLQSLFERRAGGLRITVNPSLGRAHLVVDRSFDLGAWVGSVERFGYLVGPPLKHAERRSSAIAVRMGICIAIAMNAMIF